MAAIIRDYRPGDQSATYYVCLKTGDNGDDGEPFYVDDPDALGRIYVGPYLKFSPEFARILEDEQGVCGYALATLDSHTFYQRYEREWRPELTTQFPAPRGASASWTRLESVYDAYHHPDYFCPEPYDLYPSHLHIDLLPRAQRQGHGKQMIAEVLDRLRASQSPGVHLGMSTENPNAYAFYLTLGFQELTRRAETIYLGMTLTEITPPS